MVKDKGQVTKKLQVECSICDQEKQEGKNNKRDDNGIKKGDDGKGGIEMVEEGLVMERIRIIKEERWRIVGVYVREDVEKEMERLMNSMGGGEEEGTRVIIGGDFNSRTGETWREIIIEDEEDDKKSRNR